MSEDFKNTSEWLRVQWRNPRDIFTILLIIGGDIVRVAVAQVCAGPVPYLTPVTFSFGWVNMMARTVHKVQTDDTADFLCGLGHAFCYGRYQTDAQPRA